MEFLKVKSLLKWTNGSEEKVCKKVTVTDRAFYKKIDRQIWPGHLTTTLAQGMGIQTNCGKGVGDFNSSTLYS